jgi:adenylylsulfate kinase
MRVAGAARSSPPGSCGRSRVVARRTVTDMDGPAFGDPAPARSRPGAVFVNGTVGVGKTSVAEAVGDLLAGARIPNAVIDVDSLGRAWPAPPDDRFNLRLTLRNLARVAETFVDAGMTRLVLAGVIESASDREGFETALAMPMTVVRLRADPSVIRERLIGRHRDDTQSLDWHLHRAPELDLILDRADAIDDFCVDASSSSLTDTARAVLEAVDWHVTAGDRHTAAAATRPPHDS